MIVVVEAHEALFPHKLESRPLSGVYLTIFPAVWWADIRGVESDGVEIKVGMSGVSEWRNPSLTLASQKVTHSLNKPIVTS